MKIHDRFAALRICDHPLIAHKLTLMRDRDCPKALFRALMREIALLMGYELTAGLPTEARTVETPLRSMTATALKGKKPAIVPVLRAGLVMAEGLEELMPGARIGHIGLYRDHETHRPVEYLVRLPSPEGRLFILVDPMLATGHSAVHAIDVLVRHGVPRDMIRLMALVAAPEGVEVLEKAHPGLMVYVAALDEKLNENAYIVPGLGDAGDRLFGTSDS